MKEKGIIGKVILFIAEEALLFLFLFYVLSIDGKNAIKWAGNYVGILTVYGSVFIILLITGLLGDFVKSFAYMLKSKKEIAETKMKRALISVKTAMATAFLAGLFMLIVAFIQMADSYQKIELFQEGLFTSLAMLGGNAIHGIAAVILLLPIYIRLKLRLL